MSLTPESKSKLSTTIRSLRAGLLRDLEDHVLGVYRLAVPIGQAGLAEADTVRRGRLEAWLDERTRGAGGKDARSRFLKQAVKEAAATLVNRLVFLRLLEQTRGPDDRPLRRTQIVSGGWSSKGYLEFRDYAGALLQDESEGYGTLLELVFDDLAVDLPGLYGSVGVTDLIPVPTASLRTVIEALNLCDLNGAWDDDTTLGWVYQYWNDPEREALDDKIKGGGKIEPHEIAAKTQMFTERYMVEWLLHNSLGPTWFAICRRHGWRADVEDALPGLEARRAEWRVKREAGEVALDALMPILSPLEERWKYYVLQDIPKEAVAAAPDSLRDLKLLDPACGSGHFPVIACGLLFELYREEARHRGEDGTDAWSDRAIVARILEDNLHGIDIDPRAVQIAAAALWLKARTLAGGVRPRRLNLVAPAFNLSGLPDDDPALKTLLHEVWRETGLPEDLTRGIVRALAGADHLGTLLKVDKAVAEAVLSHQIATGAFEREPDLFKHWGYQVESERVPAGLSNQYPRTLEGITDKPSASAMPFGDRLPEVKGKEPPPDALIIEKLEAFLARHTGGPDLGLRLDGEQLAAGVRFIRMVQEGTYHIVVGNPPYTSSDKINGIHYLKKVYIDSWADHYAMFMDRGLGLVGRAGLLALISYQSWMFNSEFESIRRKLVTFSVTLVCDLSKGAFLSIKLVPIALNIIRNLPRERGEIARFIRQLPHDTVVRDDEQANRNASALTFPAEFYDVDISMFSCIPGHPLPYVWGTDFIKEYTSAQKLGDQSDVRQGLATANNARFVRRPWEIKFEITGPESTKKWAPYIKGAEGRGWFEPLDDCVNYDLYGIELFNYMKDGKLASRPQNQGYYFVPGVAFSMIGQHFIARLHRYNSIFGHMGSSVFPSQRENAVCLLNSSLTRFVMSTLNPSHHFEVGDVKRIPIIPISHASEICARLDAAFTEHEAARENSVEFRRPGASAWRSAQDWAQRAVDRPAGDPLPAWAPEYDPPAPVAFVSFALGVALGRFAADGAGLVDAAPATALPHGLLFLSNGSRRDGLDHPACAGLRAAWDQHGGAVKRGAELRDWLRLDFFKHHKTLYETRPIWLPLSSAKRTFVVFAAIHRWHDGTLDEVRVLLKDERKVLDGELEDVKHARAIGDAKARGAGEKRQEELRALLTELDAFTADVEAVSERGAPPSPGGKPRTADARFVMDLDDGVMVNAAALWPLLDPQWKDPVKWWKELCEPKGRKDYDWSHLAARYFPARVDGKCKTDPSLAVAHGCFWRYHPARAYAWELRLQDEIGPDFLIREAGSDDARTRFLEEQPDLAREIEEKEQRRRERKAAKASADSDDEDGDADDSDAEADQTEES